MLGLGTVTVDGRPHALPPQEHSRVGWTGQKTQHSEREGCPGTDKGRARNGGGRQEAGIQRTLCTQVFRVPIRPTGKVCIRVRLGRKRVKLILRFERRGSGRVRTVV